MYVKPASGLVIRDPQAKDFLPFEGREVTDPDFYWTRLLNDGDVVLATPPAAQAAPADEVTGNDAA